MKTYEKWQALCAAGESHGSFDEFICNELDTMKEQIIDELCTIDEDVDQSMRQSMLGRDDMMNDPSVVPPGPSLTDLDAEALKGTIDPNAGSSSNT
jgi:hypothetical protein